FTAVTLPWASPLTSCFCFGVVTVSTLKPDCASKASFLEISLPLAAVASDADISTSTAPILAILVSVNNFFIFISKWLVCGLSFSKKKNGKFQTFVFPLLPPPREPPNPPPPPPNPPKRPPPTPPPPPPKRSPPNPPPPPKRSPPSNPPPPPARSKPPPWKPWNRWLEKSPRDRFCASRSKSPDPPPPAPDRSKPPPPAPSPPPALPDRSSVLAADDRC